MFSFASKSAFKTVFISVESTVLSKFPGTFLGLIMCFILSTSTHAELVKIPDLKSRVTDTTQSLSATQAASIESSLANLEQLKGSQVAVLIVKTTSPEAIEQFATRVFEKWKLGRQGVDDGVLLLIALDDRKMRIEVGYGLEGAIPDISAGRIIKEYIAPDFRQGNIAGGIIAGTTQIVNLINGEALPEPSTSQGNSRNDPTAILAFIVMSASLVTRFLVPLLGRLISVSIVTLAGAVIIWFVSHELILTIFAIFFVSIFSLSFSASRSSSYRDGGGSGGGYGGGFGGGGFSSGGGGGFSGGGGSSGGGGASGGW